jgi:hypothetical protein
MARTRRFGRLWSIHFTAGAIRRRSPVGQALATEAIAECIRASTPAAADWDASFAVKRINL